MRPVIWMLVALAAAPAAAYLVFRLAKGLGFLDPPAGPSAPSAFASSSSKTDEEPAPPSEL
jgi:hypothetical protein